MIDVLLVDDQPLVRAGLKLILTPADGFTIVGECDDGAAVLDAVRTLRPAVVVMDVRMKGMDGVEATRRLRELPDAPPVLILTTFDDDEVLSAALRAGAVGFLLKDAPADDLIRAVHVVAHRGAWLDPAITGHVLATYRRYAPSDNSTATGVAALTTRQRDVLRLIARGADNQEIANALEISEYAVQNDIGQIMDKLNLRNRADTIVFAFDHQLA